MTYRVLIKSSAQKSLDKLPSAERGRVASSIAALATDPRPTGSVKLTGHSNLYRVRVGSYRVIYEVGDAQLTVLVIVIAHRRESYRGL